MVPWPSLSNEDRKLAIAPTVVSVHRVIRTRLRSCKKLVRCRIKLGRATLAVGASRR